MTNSPALSALISALTAGLTAPEPRRREVRFSPVIGYVSSDGLTGWTKTHTDDNPIRTYHA